MSNAPEPSSAELVARFLLAVREQRDADAARCVQLLPALASHDPRVAVVLADETRVRAAITAGVSVISPASARS